MFWGMAKSTLYVILLLLVFWTVVIGLADGFVLTATGREFLARDFVPTRGRIVTSEIKQYVMLHGGINIEYSYVVRGREYLGHCYRYDERQTSLDGAEIKRKYPQGSVQTVYYDPRKPSDSVLSTGVAGADLMLLLFATPVSVALVLLWGWLIARLREKRRLPPAGGLRVREQGGIIRVRMSEVSAPVAGMYALGVAAFAATFPVVVVNGLAPGTEPMAWLWAAVLATAVLAGVWQAWRNASGRFDLMIDYLGQTVTLPQTCGRTERLTVPRREIAGVSLLRRVSRLASGNHDSYLPAVARLDGERGVRRERLMPWGWTEERARGFTHWFCAQMGLEFKGVEDEPPDAA